MEYCSQWSLFCRNNFKYILLIKTCWVESILLKFFPQYPCRWKGENSSPETILNIYYRGFEQEIWFIYNDLPLNKASSPKLNILYPLASFWVNNKSLRLLWGIKEQVMMHVCIAKSKLRFSFRDAYISAYFRLTNTKSTVIEHCIRTDMTQYMAKPD